MALRKISFIAIALALMLGACAQKAQTSAPPLSPALQSLLGPTSLHCDDLIVAQGGKEYQPVDGVFTLTRAPFQLIYTGNGASPSVSVSMAPRMIAVLDSFKRPVLWGSAGDYMAHEPEDLPMRESMQLSRNDTGRDKFAAALGEGYAEVLRAQVAADPMLDTVVSIPRAGGGFEKNGNRHVQTVRTVGGTPIESIRNPAIHIAYFATLQRLGPAKAGDGKSLLKMTWGSCRMAFS